jgi:hypothetical protein
VAEPGRRPEVRTGSTGDEESERGVLRPSRRPVVRGARRFENGGPSERNGRARVCVGARGAEVSVASPSELLRAGLWDLSSPWVLFFFSGKGSPLRALLGLAAGGGGDAAPHWEFPFRS